MTFRFGLERVVGGEYEVLTLVLGGGVAIVEQCCPNVPLLRDRVVDTRSESKIGFVVHPDIEVLRNLSERDHLVVRTARSELPRGVEAPCIRFARDVHVSTRAAGLVLVADADAGFEPLREFHLRANVEFLVFHGILEADRVETHVSHDRFLEVREDACFASGVLLEFDPRRLTTFIRQSGQGSQNHCKEKIQLIHVLLPVVVREGQESAPDSIILHKYSICQVRKSPARAGLVSAAL